MLPKQRSKEMTRGIHTLVALLGFLGCWALEARSQPTLRNLLTGSTVLTVGPGRDFSTIAAAVAAAQNGDTIEVQAGSYTNDYASISKNITLRAVGGTVNMVSTGLIPNGKGIFITNGNITLNNFEFTGAKVADRNGA